MHDLRYACRMLLKAPASSLLAIVTLALGIGATSAIFSVANATLLSPLPGISDAARVVTIGRVIDGQGFDNSSYPNYIDLRDQNTVFSDVAAVKPAPFSLSGYGRAERLMGAAVTANYFRTLGVRLVRGRAFVDADERDAAPVAVISEAIWRQQFGADPGVAGRRVSLNGRPVTIVGVAAGAFHGTDATSRHDVWVPISAVTTLGVLPQFFRDLNVAQERDAVWIMLYARMKPGVSLARADADVQAIAARLRAYPENAKNGWTVAPGVGLDPGERAELVRLTRLLFAAVAVLFLLACANVANLALARVAARAREVSVRLAIGATGRRVARQLLTESAVLAGAGGVAGLGVAYAATAGLSALFAESSRFSLAVDLSPDLRVVLFTVVVSCVAAVLFGLGPAVQSSRTNLVSALKDAAAAAPRPSRLRRALVVAQLTLSMMLLVAAGLLVRTVQTFNRIDAGFDPRDLALVTIEPSITGNYDPPRLRLFYDRLLPRMQALPGVEAATLARMAPVTARGWGIGARIPDKPGSIVETRGLQFNSVAANYFEVMRIPIRRGRGLRPTDTDGSPPVIVVNEVAARTFWPGENPIGRQIWIVNELQPRQVVGVAAAVKYRNLVESPRPFGYFAMSQSHPMPDAPVVVHLRTRLPLGELSAAVAREVHALDPDLPVFDVKRASSHMADSYWRQRITGVFTGALALLALALGSLGVYGVMSYAAAERTHEIGVRLALGARAADVIRLFAADGGRLIALGIVLGASSALAFGRLLATLLYGVTPADSPTFIAAALVLASAALVACAGPALRAARVDPMRALRHE